MFRVFILFIALLMGAEQTYAQGMQAAIDAKTAKQLLDNGDFSKAEKNYRRALKSSPTNYDYKYGLSMALYRQKKYSHTIKFCEEIVKDKTATVDSYRLLANSYDLHNNYEKAISTLEAAVVKYPQSGALYHDWGLIDMLREKHKQALNVWEKGIATDPSYAGNYYWAAKTYANSDVKVWAFIYGEIFMNIERGTSRSDEISKLLFDLYVALIEDETMVDRGEIALERADNSFVEANKRLFGLLRRNNMMNFERGKTIHGQNRIKSIAMMRQNFLEMWLQGFTLAYPNILSKYQREMMDLSFYEAYNFWLFSKASTKDFLDWQQQYQGKYDAFIDWFLGHPMKVDVEDFMVRSQFEPRPKPNLTKPSTSQK